MLKLRNILLCDYLYFLILLISIIYTVININIEHQSIYKNTQIDEEVSIITSHITSNKLTLEVKGKQKEVLVANYYFKTTEQLNLFQENFNLGDIIHIKGTLKKIPSSSNINSFDYQKYQKNKKIFYTVNIHSITKISSSNKLFYKIKNNLIKRCRNNSYLHLFILGDNYYLPKIIETAFQEIGISHLFAISGMHISLWSLILLKILKKLKVGEKTRYLIVAIFLLLYLIILGLSPSIIRSVLFFIFFSLNNIFYLHIRKINIFILVLSITLIIEPNFIYDVAFQYSFTISLALLLISNKLVNKKYIENLFIISIISFIVSIPICLYHFYQINFLSIIYNIFYVPLISLIIFPLSIIVFIIPFFLPIFNLLTNLLEETTIFFSNIHLFKLVLKKLDIIYYFLYYPIIIITIISIFKLKINFLLLPISLFIHYYLTINNTFILMLDIGQGDCFLIYDKKKSILIDTGGKINFYNNFEKDIISSTLTDSTIIPTLRSLGVKSLDKVILTHGDNDHLGEYKNLKNRIKIKSTYINNNGLNYYETQIENKQLLKNDMQFKTDNFIFYSLNTYNSSNENDSSIILLISYKNINLLFTGDASTLTEKHLLNNYTLPQIDFLKVGHHGSNTSTSDALLEQIKPKYALISAGKNNSFNHPHKEITNKLKKHNIKILSTKTDGSIYINFFENNYEILDKNNNIR